MKQMKRFKIGGVPEHFNLPWKLAIEERKLVDLGVELHWSDMTGGTGQMVKGLQTGTLDIAVLLTEGITKSILQGLNAKIVTVFVTTPLRWGIHVPYHSDIQTVKQLENQTFAISREGSGSHLMTYLRAKQEGWNLKDLKFNVVGDVYGGLWALENNQAQAFLWEKYTTFPFTEQKKCRYIDEVVTPWPCFVIAVRSEVLEDNKELLQTVFERVNQEAKAFKENPNAAEIIAWRYNLKLEQTQSWLSETDWNYDNSLMKDSIENVVNTLESLDLVSTEEKENWAEKVF
jgi:ABC-type nitrate/sulfonate/bicarbonate transport system substrate-binding protein